MAYLCCRHKGKSTRMKEEYDGDDEDDDGDKAVEETRVKVLPTEEDEEETGFNESKLISVRNNNI